MKFLIMARASAEPDAGVPVVSAPGGAARGPGGGQGGRGGGLRVVPGGVGVLPAVRQASSRVHGGYSRVVADGAAGGRPVLIALRVRRFRCGQPSCPPITFAEQAEGLTSRYRRRSVPLMAMLAGFGLELAGRLGVTVHPSTVLRLVAALPEPQVTAAPEVLGIDLSGFEIPDAAFVLLVTLLICQ